jgi:hypothetical protein
MGKAAYAAGTKACGSADRLDEHSDDRLNDVVGDQVVERGRNVQDPPAAAVEQDRAGQGRSIAAVAGRGVERKPRTTVLAGPELVARHGAAGRVGMSSVPGLGERIGQLEDRRRPGVAVGAGLDKCRRVGRVGHSGGENLYPPVVVQPAAPQWFVSVRVHFDPRHTEPPCSNDRSLIRRRKKRMRLSRSAAVSSKPAYVSASLPGSAAGSGMLQWIVSGLPGNSGQTSRTRSQKADDVVEALATERLQCFGRRPEMSIPRSRITLAICEETARSAVIGRLEAVPPARRVAGYVAAVTHHG